jgi:hypothetical protein
MSTGLQGVGQNPVPMTATVVPPGPELGDADSCGVVAARAGMASTSSHATITIASTGRREMVMTV